MMNFLFIVLVFWGWTSREVISNSITHDYFEVIIDRFEKFFEDPSVLSWDFKVRKVNKVRCLTGTVYLNRTIDNNVKVQVKLLKKQGGEYRYLPYTIPTTATCDMIQQDKYVYPDVIKGSSVPNICPVPAGQYQLFNVTPTMDNLPKGVLQTGEYCAEVMFLLNEDMIARYRFYAYVNVV